MDDMKGAPASPNQIDPALEHDEQDRGEEAVDPAKQWYEQYKDKPYKDLAARMVELAHAKKLAEMEVSRIGAEFDVIRLRVVPNRMADEGIKGLRIEGVGRLGLTSDAYCNLIPGAKEGLFNWMREHEYGDLIKEEVNPSSLKSLVKSIHADHLALETEFNPAADAEPDPEADKDEFEQISEFVKFTPFMRASVTKG